MSLYQVQPWKINHKTTDTLNQRKKKVLTAVSGVTGGFNNTNSFKFNTNKFHRTRSNSVHLSGATPYKFKQDGPNFSAFSGYNSNASRTVTPGPGSRLDNGRFKKIPAYISANKDNIARKLLNKDKPQKPLPYPEQQLLQPQQPQQQQQQQQQLDTFEPEGHICQLHNDTLADCLDKNGVYVCKSYGPRCFIIQKVS